VWCCVKHDECLCKFLPLRRAVEQEILSDDTEHITEFDLYICHAIDTCKDISISNLLLMLWLILGMCIFYNTEF
jgi:hypothetical protein